MPFLCKDTCSAQQLPKDRETVSHLMQVVSVYPLTDVTSGNKTVIGQAIDGIYAGSATNLSGGLFKARSPFTEPWCPEQAFTVIDCPP